MRARRIAFLAVLAVCKAATVFADERPHLSLPLACEPHKTCFIQSYVDHEDGPEFRDYSCGTATYDGHKGTDFRLLSTAVAANGVAVLASADGVVQGMRDEMDDHLLADNAHAEVAGRECGNGALIDIGGGWTTQYCHMKKGSLAVKVGDKVSRGQRLGDVGYSGLVEFAHVHLQVAKDGKIIDPFTGEPQQAACSVSPDKVSGLWMPDAAAAFAKANSEIFETLFAAQLPTWQQLEIDDAVSPPNGNSAELYFVARISNIRKDDVVRVTLNGPGGFKYTSASPALPRNRGGHLAFGVAKTKTGTPLPEGTYSGTAELVRSGSVIDTKSSTIELRR